MRPIVLPGCALAPYPVDGGRGCGYNRGMSKGGMSGSAEDNSEVRPWGVPGHGGPQPGAGRNLIPFALDDVAYLCSIDCSEVETAAALGCSPDTLRRRMREWGEVDFERFRTIKQAAGRAQIRRQLHEIASGGPLAQSKASLAALPANIWLSKQRLGYSDSKQPVGPPAIQISAILVQQLPNVPVLSDSRDNRDLLVSPNPPIVPPSPLIEGESREIPSSPQAALPAESSNDEQPSE